MRRAVGGLAGKLKADGGRSRVCPRRAAGGVGRASPSTPSASSAAPAGDRQRASRDQERPPGDQRRLGPRMRLGRGWRPRPRGDGRSPADRGRLQLDRVPGRFGGQALFIHRLDVVVRLLARQHVGGNRPEVRARARVLHGRLEGRGVARGAVEKRHGLDGTGVVRDDRAHVDGLARHGDGHGLVFDHRGLPRARAVGSAARRREKNAAHQPEWNAPQTHDRPTILACGRKTNGKRAAYSLRSASAGEMRAASRAGR